jgi:hypothetical protein
MSFLAPVPGLRSFGHLVLVRVPQGRRSETWHLGYTYGPLSISSTLTSQRSMVLEVTGHQISVPRNPVGTDGLQIPLQAFEMLSLAKRALFCSIHNSAIQWRSSSLVDNRVPSIADLNSTNLKSTPKPLRLRPH